MKKIFMFFAALVCGLTVNAKTLYLNPGVWETEGAKFALYFFNSPQDNAWGDYMTKNGSVYQGEMPDKFANVIFVRMDPNKGKDWNGKWNQTYDLAVPSDKNLYSISGWGDSGQPSPGDWSVYNGGNGGGGNGGGNEGGGNEGGGNELEESGEDHEFALIGSIGGDWNVTEMKDEYKFDNRGRWTGTLSANPSSGKKAAFVVIMDEEGNQYKTKGWQGEAATKVTLYWANGFSDSNVWQLPSDETLYIIMRKCTFKGTIDVEKVDKATYEAYTIDWGPSNSGGNEGGGNEGGGNGDNPGNQAVDNTPVVQKAHKVFVDGQLRIIRGDKMFDATGRQL